MSAETGPDAPRLASPNRSQLLLEPTDLERLVAPDHPVRAVWALVEKLDLSAFLNEVAARGCAPGRPATDPRVLLCLWVFATSEGIGSARQLARLCERDAPYRWICGGVSVNHHTLSDFRTTNGSKVDDLLTQTLGALMMQRVVTLYRVAQDGMKVRASAGAASFRRRKRLEDFAKEARKQVARLKSELEEDAAAGSRREQAARERAVRERQEAVDKALAQLTRIEAQRAKRNQEKPSEGKRAKEARASTTDGDSRVMKMADGGFRPAYNVQLATDSSGFIVGADVTNNGTDQSHVTPMLDDIERRTGQTPQQYLVDGGFVGLDNIDEIAARGATPYAPVPKPRQENVDPFKPKPKDSPAQADWRQRMGTAEAKEIYVERGVLAERTNADLRGHRGLDRLNVRGLDKVKSVVLFAALSFNLLRMIAGGLTL